MEAVGVRDLRQNLSAYLRRVADGERFLVTDHREPVAILGPLPADEDTWEALIAAGVMTRPLKDVAELPPAVRLDDPYALTKALEEEREERFP
jgi:prevent-host-death family protein